MSMATRIGLICLFINTQWYITDATARYNDYRGCYVESPPQYNFFWWSRTSWDGNNKVQCIDTCYKQDFYFAGLNNRDDCYCGNGYLDTYGNSTGCYNVTISRVPGTVGRRTSTAVYATGRRLRQSPMVDPRYIGCWRGKTGIFGNHFVVISKANPQMTVDLCINQCHNQSHIFMAISLGTNCYCGNSLHYNGEVQPIESANCYSPCSGSPRENCGSKTNGKIVAVYRNIPKTCKDGYYGRLCKFKCQCAGYPCNRDTGDCIRQCRPGSTLPQCRRRSGSGSLCNSCIWSNTTRVISRDLRFLTMHSFNNTEHEPQCRDPFLSFFYNGSTCDNATYCVKFNFTLNSVFYIVRDCLKVPPNTFSCTPFQNTLLTSVVNAGGSSLGFSCCQGNLCNGSPCRNVIELTVLFSLIGCLWLCHWLGQYS